MKAQDLRIGNYIKDGHEIEQVTIEHLQCLASRRCEFDPVPLTEDLLKNIGCFQHPFFKKTRLCLPQMNGCTTDLQLNVSDNGGFIVCIVNDSDTMGTALNIVRELHELQNICFALTGLELNIKLD